MLLLYKSRYDYTCFPGIVKANVLLVAGSENSLKVQSDLDHSPLHLSDLDI